MKSIIIHHHDLDGFTAGSVALLAFPGSDSVSLNYESSAKIPSVEDLAEYERVVVVDYTVPPETMKALNEAGLVKGLPDMSHSAADVPATNELCS